MTALLVADMVGPALGLDITAKAPTAAVALGAPGHVAVADYGLVGDLFTIVPELTRALAKSG